MNGTTDKIGPIDLEITAYGDWKDDGTTPNGWFRCQKLPKPKNWLDRRHIECVRIFLYMTEWGPVYGGWLLSEAVANEAKAVELLAAIYTVNKAAKRWRDAAKTHYQAGRFGLSTYAKCRKEKCYELKDDGIMRAYHDALLKPTQIHGGLCLYEGSGYRLHSYLVPRDVEIPNGDVTNFTVEAKPKGAGEARMSDAEFTLGQLAVDESAFFRMPEQQLARRSSVKCFRCGEEGHIASECPQDDEPDYDDEYVRGNEPESEWYDDAELERWP